MSVYVSGIEMPTCCGECRFLDEYGDYPNCIITDEQRGYDFRVREKRMPHCPLFPVPNHGRLGDLDALEKAFREDAREEWNKWARPLNWADAFADVADIVGEEPTIIPADRSKA